VDMFSDHSVQKVNHISHSNK